MTNKPPTSAITAKKEIALPEFKDERNTKHRIAKFKAWVGDGWIKPDLAAYAEHLLEKGNTRDSEKPLPMAPDSVRAHLATVRQAYRHFLRQDNTRDWLFEMARRQGFDTMADQSAYVTEVISRILNAIDTEAVKIESDDDSEVPDEHKRWLKPSEAKKLINAPDVSTLPGIRNRAIIGMMLGTGVRRFELANLDVSDLTMHRGGELSLFVKRGKGRKARLIPYGEFDFGLKLAQIWLRESGIIGGPVFRGFWKGYKKVRPSRLSLTAIEDILRMYSLMIGGTLDYARPHDLRRTYARLLYESGMDIMGIRDNLGHNDIRTTQLYIGVSDVKIRKPTKRALNMLKGTVD